MFMGESAENMCTNLGTPCKTEVALMISFFPLFLFLVIGFAACHQTLGQPTDELNIDDTRTTVPPLNIVLITKEASSDPGLIKLRAWDFDQAVDVSGAFSCLTLCIEENSFDGAVAMMDIATGNIRQLLFEHTVCEALSQKNGPFAIRMLSHFHELPLPLAAFVKLRNCGCKEVLPYFMYGWKYRYPDFSVLEIMDQIVASCVHFNESKLLFAFLSVSPFLSAGTLTAFEDAIISNNVPIAAAILRSGVLGLNRMYSRMTPKLAEFRKSMRAKAHELIMKGSVLQLHDHIGEVEIPFIIQMMEKSVYQPRSFVYLINRFGNLLVKTEALSLYKAACIAGHPDVLHHAFKIISGLKYDIPMVLNAFKSSTRLDAEEIIQCAESLQYVPRRHEVAHCIELMINDSHAISLLLKTWPQYLLISEVFALFPRLIATNDKTTILSAIKLCKHSHLFTYQRYVAFSLMAESNHRGLALQQRQMFQRDPDLLYAVLNTVDPRLFGRHGRPTIAEHIMDIDERAVQEFLNTSSSIFHGRIRRCMDHLRRINAAMKNNTEPKGMLVKMFIRDGGSWEELALLAVKYQGQEKLLREALEQENTDPFIVDPDTKVALLDWPGISEEAKDIILQAQWRMIARNHKLSILWTVMPLKDTFLLIADKYRQIAVNTHRKVFDHNSN